jgi:hypothetical protein
MMPMLRIREMSDAMGKIQSRVWENGCWPTALRAKPTLIRSGISTT